MRARAPSSALFESVVRDYGRKEAMTENCMHQTVSEEIREYTCKNSVANSIRTHVYRMWVPPLDSLVTCLRNIILKAQFACT